MLEKAQKALGLPSLERVAEVLAGIPDSEKLKLIKALLVEAKAIKGTPEELETLVRVVEIIRDTPLEKLVAIRDMLKEIRALVKTLGKDLPIKDILEEMKSEKS